MKQTAVEWLWEQIDNTIPFQNIQTSQIFNGLLEQAKAMEKEQIIDTYWASYKEGKYSTDKTADEYYNETFKQD